MKMKFENKEQAMRLRWQNLRRRSRVSEIKYLWVVYSNDIGIAGFVNEDDAMGFKRLMEEVYSDCKFVVQKARWHKKGKKDEVDRNKT